MAKHVKIEMTEHGRGRVWMDGEEVSDVVAIQFEAESGGKNIVHLSILAPKVDIEVGESTEMRDQH